MYYIPIIFYLFASFFYLTILPYGAILCKYAIHLKYTQKNAKDVYVHRFLFGEEYASQGLKKG